MKVNGSNPNVSFSLHSLIDIICLILRILYTGKYLPLSEQFLIIVFIRLLLMKTISNRCNSNSYKNETINMGQK